MAVPLRLSFFFFFFQKKSRSTMMNLRFSSAEYFFLCTVTLFSDFLGHFVVGKNNGGHVSFQTKHAQQVSCLSVVVVYIVLCSEIYTTAPERSRMLNDCRTKTTQDRSVELCKPVLDSMNFHHC